MITEKCMNVTITLVGKRTSVKVMRKVALIVSSIM